MGIAYTRSGDYMYYMQRHIHLNHVATDIITNEFPSLLPSNITILSLGRDASEPY